MKEKEARAIIVDICKKMWQLGWVAANDGNVTCLLDDGTLLATPTGISKSMMTSDMLIKVDKEGNVLSSEDGYKPSSELKMHLQCYKDRDDVKAVVHAHPPAATAFAVSQLDLDRYTMIESIVSLGSVPITPYGAPSTNEVPNSIRPYIKEHDVVLLENHGALALGCDLYNAYFKMETLELTAKINIYAEILGGAKEISKEKVDRLCDLRKNYYKVPGRHPGFKHYRETKKDE